MATTASGENAELVRSLGADVVVDYTKEDFAEVLSGYDVVLDSLGGENLEKSLTVLKPGGQAIGVDRPAGPRVRQAARGAEVHRRRDGAAEPQDPQAGAQARRELLVPVHAGQRRPTARAGLPSTTPATSARVIDKTFPFDQTLEALAYVEQGRANGKVVITLD